MKKLVLLLSVIVLLVFAPGAVSAAKPAPDTFTITGYTTLLEELKPLPNGHFQVHILAQGGGEEICRADTGKVCGVSGDLDGSFTFEEWIDVNPVNGKAKNEGIITIIGAEPKDTAVVMFKGQVDLAARTVSGKFKVDKKQGAGAYDGLEGQGDYTGDADSVFTVTFTGKLKGLPEGIND